MNELRNDIKATLEKKHPGADPITEEMIDIAEAMIIAKRIKKIDMDHFEEIREKTFEAFHLVIRASNLLDVVSKLASDITEEHGELHNKDIQYKLHSTLEALDYMVDDDHNDKYSGEYCIEKKAQKIMDKLSEFDYA